MMQCSVWLAAAVLAVVPVQNPNLRVHDLAGLLSAEQRQSLEGLAHDVERETSAQLAVVTVPSLDGQTVETYAHELFNLWGVGGRDRNNGVLLLVAPKERRMRIEVGYGLEPILTDSLCGQIRDEQIIPRFKANDYPGGIVAGTQKLAEILRAKPEEARGALNSAPPILRQTSRREAVWASGAVAAAAVGLLALGIGVAVRRLYSTTTFALVSLVGLALVGVAAFLTFRAPRMDQPIGMLGFTTTASLAAWVFNLFRYRRFGPHGCSKCGTRLELLSEQDEDPKLSAVQRLEEQLGSVDYDVWLCPACLNADTERYLKPFSGFKDCPSCHARTFKEETVILVPATTISMGEARVDGRCVSCNHKTVQHIVLPMLPQPSTTSSGSSSSSTSSMGGFGGGGGGGGGGGFGGGSSGGGGASGGW